MLEKEEKRKNLICRYEELSAVKNYIYGFIYKGNLYAYSANTIEAVLDKASSKNGGGYSLRYRPTAKEKMELVTSGKAKRMTSEEKFMKIVGKLKYARPNRGEGFEKILIEFTGKKWKKNAVPFTERGDAKILGTDYQIKFEKATFASEKQIETFEKARKEKEEG